MRSLELLDPVARQQMDQPDGGGQHDDGRE
jgi:hypothetical protein